MGRPWNIKSPKHTRIEKLFRNYWKSDQPKSADKCVIPVRLKKAFEEMQTIDDLSEIMEKHGLEYNITSHIHRSADVTHIPTWSSSKKLKESHNCTDEARHPIFLGRLAKLKASRRRAAHKLERLKRKDTIRQKRKVSNVIKRRFQHASRFLFSSGFRMFRKKNEVKKVGKGEMGYRKAYRQELLNNKEDLGNSMKECSPLVILPQHNLQLQRKVFECTNDEKSANQVVKRKRKRLWNGYREQLDTYDRQSPETQKRLKLNFPKDEDRELREKVPHFEEASFNTESTKTLLRRAEETSVRNDFNVGTENLL